MTRRMLMAWPLLRLTAQDTPTIRMQSRMVEVHVTVLDRRNRHIPNLDRRHFEVYDADTAQNIAAFEPETANLTLAILLDTTGSMAEAMPALKIAATRLIEQLREGDRVAVYGFSERLERLQGFTDDRRAAILAVRRARTGGATALFDAIARVSQSMPPGLGKKSMVVFTDGADNSSLLNMNAATARAKKAGIPLYTVAQGDALKASRLVETLEDISQRTAGMSFKVRNASQIEEVFEAISADLKHTYMLAYQPRSGQGEWRPIRVVVNSVKDVTVRCREGYFAD